jgi:hypothetical protein
MSARAYCRGKACPDCCSGVRIRNPLSRWRGGHGLTPDPEREPVAVTHVQLVPVLVATSRRSGAVEPQRLTYLAAASRPQKQRPAMPRRSTGLPAHTSDADARKPDGSILMCGSLRHGLHVTFQRVPPLNPSLNLLIFACKRFDTQPPQISGLQQAGAGPIRC